MFRGGERRREQTFGTSTTGSGPFGLLHDRELISDGLALTSLTGHGVFGLIDGDHDGRSRRHIDLPGLLVTIL